MVRLLDLAEQETHQARPTLYDPLAIAAIFRPDLLDFQAGTVDVPFSSGGQAVFHPSAGSKTQVAAKVNAHAFLELFAERMSRAMDGLR
jgi:inosine-uridine nucleoside N-ribohydrolase